jgi:hypothetical protein
LRRLRSEGRDVPVRGIDDEPRLVPFAEIEDLQPPLIGSADFAVGQSGDRLLRRLLAYSGDVFGSQILELATVELFGSFEWCRIFVRVRVDTLQIRVAPGSARWRIAAARPVLRGELGEAERNEKRDSAAKRDESCRHQTPSPEAAPIIDHSTARISPPRC